MLTIRVLGPIEVRRDSELLSVPSGRTTQVLVRLALDAGRQVRAERITEDLWADAAVTTGRNTLQSKISQLRRALGEPGVIKSGNGGYTLAVGDSCVDALQVTGLAGAAAAARRSGDVAAALDAATRGCPCSGVRRSSTRGTATGSTPTGCV